MSSRLARGQPAGAEFCLKTRRGDFQLLLPLTRLHLFGRNSCPLPSCHFCLRSLRLVGPTQTGLPSPPQMPLRRLSSAPDGDRLPSRRVTPAVRVGLSLRECRAGRCWTQGVRALDGGRGSGPHRWPLSCLSQPRPLTARTQTCRFLRAACQSPDLGAAP